MVAGLKRCRMPAVYEAGTLSQRRVSMCFRQSKIRQKTGMQSHMRKQRQTTKPLTLWQAQGEEAQHRHEELQSSTPKHQ